MQNLKKNFYQITPYVLLSVDVYNIYRTPQAFADNLAVSICLTSLLGNKYGDMNKIFGANIMNIFIKADKFLKLDYIQPHRP